MGKTFDKTGVYHSSLVKECPLNIRFTGEVRASKFAGKPDWVPFRVVGAGDETEYQLNVENEGIGDAIRYAISEYPQGQVFEANAKGSREAAALVLDAVDDDSPANVPEKMPQRTQEQPQRSGQGAAPTSLARGLWECLQAAHDLNEAFSGKFGREMTENERTIAISLYIERNRGGGRTPLVG